MSERFTDLLRKECDPLWGSAVHHRFVTELVSGQVANSVMAAYLVQDYRFLDRFLTLLGAAMATADTPDARLRLARFAGLVAGEENTYFERAFEALGVDERRRLDPADTAATQGFKEIMGEAAASRSYAAALAVLTVSEWLYLDWASRAPAPRPANFVHAEWISLHDNAGFRSFVAFLRRELDRAGPAAPDMARAYFQRTVALEHAFFDSAYEGERSEDS